MVHFNFYQSQRRLRRLAQSTGTNTNRQAHGYLDEAQFISNLIKSESEFYSGF